MSFTLKRKVTGQNYGDGARDDDANINQDKGA